MQQLSDRASKGDVASMLALGYLYLEGAAAPRDAAEAARWYGAAAARKHPVAMNNYGWMHEHGIGVRNDPGEAARWYRQAAEAGHVEAMTNLGQLHKYGLAGVETLEDGQWYRPVAPLRERRPSGVVRNDAVAMSWLRRAAAAGEGRAMAEIAEMYRYGRTDDDPGDKRREVVIMWAEKAAAAGNPQGLWLMADYPLVIARPPVQQQAGQRMTAEDLARLRSPQARAAAGAQESEIQRQREDDRIRWTRRAAEMGHPRAIVELARWITQLGRARLYEQELPRIATWLRQAADAGDADAMAELGSWYFRGHGLTQDEREGVRWTLKAVDAGSVSGYQMLSDFYSTGSYGYPRDPAKARSVLEQLATHPDVDRASMGKSLLAQHDSRQSAAPKAGPWENLRPVLLLGAAFLAVALVSGGGGGAPSDGGPSLLPLAGGSGSSKPKSCRYESISMQTVHGTKSIMGGPGLRLVCY